MANSEYKRVRARNHNMLRLEKQAYWEDKARLPVDTSDHRERAVHAHRMALFAAMGAAMLINRDKGSI